MCVCVFKRVGAVKYLECMFNCYLKKYNAVTKNCVHFFYPQAGDTVPKFCVLLKLTNGAQLGVECIWLQVVSLCRVVPDCHVLRLHLYCSWHLHWALEPLLQSDGDKCSKYKPTVTEKIEAVQTVARASAGQKSCAMMLGWFVCAGCCLVWIMLPWLFILGGGVAQPLTSTCDVRHLS